MFLLDTCSLLWMTGDPGRLSKKAKKTIFSDDSILHYSAISAFELQWLQNSGRIELPERADVWLISVAEQYRLMEIRVDTVVAASSVRLPLIHKDPCDRILIATAAMRKLVLITADQTIATYPDIKVLW